MPTAKSVLRLVAQGALPDALRMLMCFGEDSVLVARYGHPWYRGASFTWVCDCPRSRSKDPAVLQAC